MRRLWQGIQKTIFWSYERGSWPYDLMVIAIVAFVLVTPRQWFRDTPQNAVFSGGDIVLLPSDDQAQLKTYRLNANLLPPAKRTAKPTPELERETHDLLGQNVDDLRGHTFQVRRIAPVKRENGSIEYYDVTVKSSGR